MLGIRRNFLTVLYAGLLLAGCASMGDVFGGDDDPYGERITEVRGTVERVDSYDSVVYLEDSDVYRSGLRNEGYGENLAIYFDESTVVEYEGRTYDPRDLERGDRIVADVDDQGNRLVARQIEVTYDVTRAGGGYGDEGDDFGEVRGVVRWLDTRNRTLELDDADWRSSFQNGDSRDTVLLYYDDQTRVEYQGRLYEPENLEPGDEVEVEVRDLGNRYLAEKILVVASVSN